MKILWITNTAIGVLGKKLYGSEGNGVWMSALLYDFIQAEEYQIVVATTANIKKEIRIEESGVVYYALPSQVAFEYDENKKKNIAAWQKLLREEKPDLIHIWGTECSHGLCALREAKDIPSVIYMQGYLGSISRYYFAGMSSRELKRTVTLRDILKRDSIQRQQHKYSLGCEKEKEMLRLAGAVVCENDWCEESVLAISPALTVYRCPLSINNTFMEHQWKYENVEKHSIICTASGYPLKGLHAVLRALAILKEDYSDVKLYIPGEKMISDGSIQWMLRKRGYTKYIEKLIQDLKLEKNIVWMGYIAQEQLAEQYEKTQVFVLSSSIENHSSSLKEAMMVGTPSIASAVGGVPEYVHHKENGFLYRFEEYEVMARYVKKIFEDKNLANRFSQNGRKEIRALHDSNNIYGTIVSAYHEILERNRNEKNTNNG